VSSSGNEDQLQGLSFKESCFVVNVALDHGDNPFGVNFLVEEVLANAIVPKVSFIAGVPNVLLAPKIVTSHVCCPLPV